MSGRTSTEGTGTPEPRKSPILEPHQALDKWAVLQPDAVAIDYLGDVLTYAQLQTKSIQLSWALQRAGVGAEDIVAISLDRSADFLVAILAVLRAGGAYLPLEAGLPESRIQYMLTDSGSRAVICRRADSPVLDNDRIRRVCLDDIGLVKESQDSRVSTVARTSSHLAYVMYTSGSTGAPKAVAVERRHLTNYITGMLQRLRLGPGATFGLVSSFNTDLGNTAVFPALCSGGLLRVLSKEAASDPIAFVNAFAGAPVDVLKMTPSLLAALLEHPRSREALPRKFLVLGGEPLTWALMQRLWALQGTCEVINHYGPTETTVGVLTWHAERSDERTASTVPIGLPLSGVDIHVVNGDMMEVPTGSAGELVIGGLSVARGYLGLPAETALRFMPDPWSASRGARLYRSGDWVRKLPDGAIEFLGRVDSQVKIRGFRVEPEEVEATMARHESVTVAVVVAREDAVGNHLVAYVQPTDPKAFSASDLLAWLPTQLPEFMVPQSIVTLMVVPRTASGKIDRKVLSGASQDNPIGSAARVVTTLSELEISVADVFATVLKRPDIWADSDFFELGGHSLLAIRAIAALERRHPIGIPIHLLFDNPTVGALAAALQSLMDAGGGRVTDRANVASDTINSHAKPGP